MRNNIRRLDSKNQFSCKTPSQDSDFEEYSAGIMNLDCQRYELKYIDINKSYNAINEFIIKIVIQYLEGMSGKVLLDRIQSASSHAV